MNTESADAIDFSVPQAWAPLIYKRLEKRFQTSTLEVLDESAQHAGQSGANAIGMNSHLRIRIASDQFSALSRVQRHRLVYDALQDFLDQGLHALAIEFL